MIIQKRLPCIFMCDGERGEESLTTGETERERECECERQSVCGEGDSVGPKIKTFCINT